MRTTMETFYKPVLRLVFPVVLQRLLSVAVSSADVLMLSRVGQEAMSAASLASQYTHILLLVYIGLGTGITMLCAQYWGKRDLQAIELVEGIALRFAVGIGLAACLAACLFPETMMRLFTGDPELVRLGSEYLRVISVSYLFWGISEVYLATLRSVERVGVSTALNALALVLNICLNAVLIFGLFGAPKMGVVGGALATSISRFTELAACFAVSRTSREVHLRMGMMFRKNKALFRDFVRLSLPAVGNDISWSVAFSMYSVILGHLSSDMVAANAIVSVVRQFATVLCFSFADAATIWLGKRMGQNLTEVVRKDSRRLLGLTVAAGALGGVVVLLITPLVLRVSNLTPGAMENLKSMLLINSYYVMGAAVNTVLVVGIFRAGGDSRFGLICDTVDMWCYAVPLGFLAAFVWKLPHMVVYFLLCTDEFVKWPVVIHHFRSDKWIRNITRDYRERKAAE